MSSKTWKNGKISSPMDLNYMRVIRFTFNLIGSWPDKVFGEPPSKLPLKTNSIMFSLVSFLLIFVIKYIKNNVNILSFFELGHSYICVFVFLLSLQCYSMPWTSEYQIVIKEFVLEIHLFHLKNKSDYAMKMYKLTNTISTLLAKYLLVQLYFGILMYNMTAWYHNYQSGVFKDENPGNLTFVHAIYYDLPLESNFNSYVFFFILNFIVVGSNSICLSIFDLCLSVIVFHVWGHLKILINELESFPKPLPRKEKLSVESLSFSIDESRHVSDLLNESINHHKTIVQFIAKTSKAFGQFVCVLYSFHLVTGCIVLFECSTLNAEPLAQFGHFAFLIFQQLFRVSIIFELLGSESERLQTAVYNLPWEYMDTKNRKQVLFFLGHVQTPISLKALGIVPVGVKTMASIFKTTLSYFIMLHNFATNEE